MSKKKEVVIENEVVQVQKPLMYVHYSCTLMKNIEGYKKGSSMEVCLLPYRVKNEAGVVEWEDYLFFYVGEKFVGKYKYEDGFVKDLSTKKGRK